MEMVKQTQSVYGLMIFIRARNLPRFESALGVPITELVGQTIEIEGELSLYGGYLPSLAHRVQAVFNEDTEIDLNMSR